jgi:hypothetical protein
VESSSSGLNIVPAPGRLVIRPFDTLSPELQRLGIVMPDNAVHGRNSNGIIVAYHRGPTSVMITQQLTPVPAAEVSIYPVEVETYWLNLHDQVVFPAMSGNEIVVPEPTADQPRRQQRYILIQERDVIAKISAPAGIDTSELAVEPRQFVAR